MIAEPVRRQKGRLVAPECHRRFLAFAVGLAWIRAMTGTSLLRSSRPAVRREVGGLKVAPFNLPDGCVGAY
ncbi:hypothetical protein [Minwuia thermotolerans]|uniref:hypothetical protein n=1 Tax=Minwuia thermotolerans TaxID=2056226 RepID=UPI0013DE2E91|nr:hypothetical protein [Minwuia thermotolerans]